MMNKKPVETIMGIVVIFVAAFFLYFAYQVSDLQVVKGYDINARFLKVGGLNVGSDVRINGIKVGTVIAQNLDPEDYVADVKLSISSNIQLPKDSVVSVVSDGLVGNKFIKIEPFVDCLCRRLRNSDQYGKDAGHGQDYRPRQCY